mmetsp:Transcript_75827/g.209253  ORF Transcript_75827/g.209253 Transcript_75827/m.209253 type:complete len:216 (-) Transcript_75827:58-705(-)
MAAWALPGLALPGSLAALPTATALPFTFALALALPGRAGLELPGPRILGCPLCLRPRAGSRLLLASPGLLHHSPLRGVEGLHDAEELRRVLLHEVDHLQHLLRVFCQLADCLEQARRVQLGGGDAGDELQRAIAGLGEAVGKRLLDEGAEVAFVVLVLEGHLGVVRQMVAPADLHEDKLPLRGDVRALRELDAEAPDVAAHVDLQGQCHLRANRT